MAAFRGTGIGAAFLAAVLIAGGADAATFHVDEDVPASGTGRSWASAWKRFADIDWSAVRPGDTIAVSGGTYRETLTVGRSGAPGRPITIAAASEPGRDGAVVIDGENRRPYGIVLRGRDHVTVRGFAIRNHAEAGVSVKEAKAGVVIEENSVHSGDPGGGNARGYDVRNSVGENAVVVRRNSYATPGDTLAQTDGIWSSGNDGVVFEQNRIVISNSNTNGHSDGFQSYQDRSVTVRDNWIEQANRAATHNHGMWISDSRAGGTIRVHGNVVLAFNLTRDSAVTHWHSEGWGEIGAIELRNNTILGGRRALNLDRTPHAEVKNNILVPADGGFGIVVQNCTIPAIRIDGNLIWAPRAAIAWIEGAAKDWAEWRTLGYDANGLNADPWLAGLLEGIWR